MKASRQIVPPREKDVVASGTIIGGNADADSNIVHVTQSIPEGLGDGTVPQQSGMGPAQGVKQLFPTRGYDHQGSYANESMLALTLQLIARIALEAK